MPIWLALLIGSFAFILIMSFLEQYTIHSLGGTREIDYLLYGTGIVFVYVYLVSAMTYSRETEDQTWLFLRRLPISPTMLVRAKIRAIIHSTLALTAAVATLFTLNNLFFQNWGQFIYHDWYLREFCAGIPLAFLIGLFVSARYKRQWTALISGVVILLIINWILVPLGSSLWKENVLMSNILNQGRLIFIVFFACFAIKDTKNLFEIVEAEDPFNSKRITSDDYRRKQSVEKKRSAQNSKKPSEIGMLFRYTLARFRLELLWSGLIFIFSSVLLIFFYIKTCHLSFSLPFRLPLLNTILHWIPTINIAYVSACIAVLSLLTVYWSLLSFNDLAGRDGRLLMRLGIRSGKFWLARIIFFGALLAAVWFIFCLIPMNKFFRHVYYEKYWLILSYKILPIMIFSAGIFFSASLRGLALSLAGMIATVCVSLAGFELLKSNGLYEGQVFFLTFMSIFFLFGSWRSVHIRLKSREDRIFNFKFYAVFLVLAAILCWNFSSLRLWVNPALPLHKPVYSARLDQIRLKKLEDQLDRLRLPNSNESSVSKSSAPCKSQPAFEKDSPYWEKTILQNELAKFRNNFEPDPADLAVPFDIRQDPDREDIRRELETASLFKTDPSPSDTETKINALYVMLYYPQNERIMFVQMANQGDPQKLAACWDSFVRLYRETKNAFLTDPNQFEQWILQMILLRLDDYSPEQVRQAITLLERIPDELPDFGDYCARFYSRSHRISFCQTKNYFHPNPVKNNVPFKMISENDAKNPSCFWYPTFRFPGEQKYYQRLLWNTFQEKLRENDLFKAYAFEKKTKSDSDEFFQKLKNEIEIYISHTSSSYEKYTWRYISYLFQYNRNAGGAIFWSQQQNYTIQNELLRRFLLIAAAYRLRMTETDLPLTNLSELVEKGWLKKLPRPMISSEEDPGYLLSKPMSKPEKKKIKNYARTRAEQSEITARYSLERPVTPSWISLSPDCIMFLVMQRYSLFSSSYNRSVPRIFFPEFINSKRGTETPDSRMIWSETPFIYDPVFGICFQLSP